MTQKRLTYHWNIIVSIQSPSSQVFNNLFFCSFLFFYFGFHRFDENSSDKLIPKCAQALFNGEYLIFYVHHLDAGSKLDRRKCCFQEIVDLLNCNCSGSKSDLSTRKTKVLMTNFL